MNILNNLKINVDVVRTSVSTPSWSKRKFPYPHHRIYYVFDGEATLILNDSRHTLKPGNIYLIPAFSMVEAICRDHFSHRYVHFKLQSSDVFDIFSIYNPLFELPATQETNDLLDTLEALHKEESPYAIMSTYSAMYKLLAPFFRDCQRPVDDQLRFEPVLNYIDHNLGETISNKTLATILGLDPVYFANLFSKTFDVSPNQYIIKKRLELAQTLLLSTDYKVYEVARHSGFDNHMYFSRLFKQKIGVTPGTYRKTNTR